MLPPLARARAKLERDTLEEKDKLIGYAGVLLAAVFVIGGIWLIASSVTILPGTMDFYSPYNPQIIGLLIAGFASFAISLGLLSRAYHFWPFE